MFEEQHWRPNSRIFKNTLYVFILLKCIIWFLNFDLLFGANALSWLKQFGVSTYSAPAFLLHHYSSSGLSFIFLSVLLVLTSVQLLRRSTLAIVDLLIAVIVLNIHTVTYTSTTAGDPLLVNICFLSAFLQKGSIHEMGAMPELRRLLHNMSYVALMLQMCILYFYSSLAKWFDPDWFGGNAVHLVNMTTYYSRPWLADHADALMPLSRVLTYVVLIYQTLFPVLVFVKPVKRYFLWIGILMHLYISCVIGLYFFGIIMLITYILFLDMPHPERELKKE